MLFARVAYLGVLFVDSNPSGSVIRIRGFPLASRKTEHRLSDELTAKFVGGLFDKE